METFSALLAFCEWNLPVTGDRWIPLTKASDAELWGFSYLRLNKLLSKQSRPWWFETPFYPVWRHYNDTVKPPDGSNYGTISKEAGFVQSDGSF